MTTAHGVPGLGQDGLVELSTFSRAIRAIGRDALVRTLGVPVLVLEGIVEGDLGPGERIDTPAPERELSMKKTLELDYRAQGGRYQGRMALLAKRNGNPFPDMISVGRAMNNDIVLLLPTVSKMHGYFRRADEAWSMTDPRSSNGTLLNGRPLERGIPHSLASGDVLQFGHDVRGTFLEPTALLDRLASAGLAGLRASPGLAR
jgi:hypothetical protein